MNRFSIALLFVASAFGSSYAANASGECGTYPNCIEGSICVNGTTYVCHKANNSCGPASTLPGCSKESAATPASAPVTVSAPAIPHKLGTDTNEPGPAKKKAAQAAKVEIKKPAAPVDGVLTTGGSYKYSNMPTGGSFGADGLHVGDCLMRRGGAQIRFMDDGRIEFDSTIRSEDSGDEFYMQFWTEDSAHHFLFHYYPAKSPTMGRSSDISWQLRDGTYNAAFFSQITYVNWYSPGCH